MKFSQVVGHQEVKEHLAESVNSGKLSHAQLFAGKLGFGGLPLALAFTQYLFCEAKSANDSCGECPSCRKMSKLEHPDLHFSFPTVQTISKTSNPLIPEWREQVLFDPVFDLNDWTRRMDKKERKPIIGTEESQEIIRKLSLRSYEGGYKVMIIWKAEEMNSTCSNKLLKILEEPPAKTLFILITEEPDSILTTIRSRTQIVKLGSPDLDSVMDYLTQNYKIGRDTAESLAARSNGDLVLAKQLAENSEQGNANRELFIQLMRVCYKKNVIEMVRWSEEMGSTSKMNQKDFLLYALHLFRQSMLKNYTGDLLTRVSEEESQFLEKFSRFITGNNIHDFQDKFSKAHYYLERNANSELLFTDLCFHVMRYIHAA